MAGEKGSSAVNLRAYEETIRACEEQLLRSHIESAAAGKINLTDEQLVDLLLSAFPQSYSRCDRKDLTKRVAKITPLPCRRDDAVDEPTPVTNKRRKVDENRNASGENEVLSSSASANCPQDSKRRELDQSKRNVWEKEMNENGGDVNVKKRLAVTDELGDGRRKMNKNGDGGWRDGSGNNRPILSDLYGMDKDAGLVEN